MVSPGWGWDFGSPGWGLRGSRCTIRVAIPNSPIERSSSVSIDTVGADSSSYSSRRACWER